MRDSSMDRMRRRMTHFGDELGDNVSRVIDAVEETTKRGASHIRDEVKSFGLQTSMKGVPRAIKNKNYFLKFVWAFGVCALFGMFLSLLLCFTRVFQSQQQKYFIL